MQQRSLFKNRSYQIDLGLLLDEGQDNSKNDEELVASALGRTPRGNLPRRPMTASASSPYALTRGALRQSKLGGSSFFNHPSGLDFRSSKN